MTVLLILVLTGLMDALDTFDVQGGTSSGVSLALGYLLLTAHFVGDLFKRAGLPRLTGYIATGIAVGPGVLGLVNEQMLGSLHLVNGVAVALIAMTAGCELEHHSMKPLLRSIGSISLYGVIGTTLLLALAVYVVRSWLPFMHGASVLAAALISTVLGVVMVAQSPAVVVALRDEMAADGPVSRTVLGVVVLADLLVILMFAVVSSIAKAVLGGGVDAVQTVRGLAWELFGSLSLGVAIGYLLALYLRKVKASAALFVLLIAFVIAEVGDRLSLDPLLVALAAGIFVRNATSAGDELYRHIQAPALPVYILFFAVAGANVHLDALTTVGAPALLFVLVRAAGLLSGSALGARLANAPSVVQRYAGFGLLPQAGLALALSLLFAETFPEFGVEARALTLSVVAINELMAPVFYRMALIRSGEANQAAAERSTGSMAPSKPLLPDSADLNAGASPPPQQRPTSD